MMNKEKLTVIILNYNSSLECEKCISFCQKQKYDNLNIIVVDNASTNQNEKIILQQICREKKNPSNF